jgi:hypothetical protein
MILYVIFGTLLHESGHILIAKLLGYKTLLHYASMNWYLPNGIEGTEITDKIDNFSITLGGNIMLDAISLLFLALLYFRKNLLPQWLYWLSVFMSMLTYRHIMLTIVCLGNTIMYSKPMAYGSDESEIATYLSLSKSVVGIPLFILALTSCYILFFRVLDSDFLRSYSVPAAIGAVAGYIIWLHYLGPILMP